MATLGPNDLKQYALPAGWDAGLLTKRRLESGETYDQLLNDIAGALAIANADLMNDPLIGGLIFVSDSDTVEYRTGVSNGFEDHTEYGTPDAKRAASTGHMLPLKPYDRKLGWTWDFLRKARRFQIDNDIASGMTDLRDIWQKKVLTRHFKSTYDAVGSGKSMPYADGGTADSTYIPPAYPARGGSFLYTHNHYLRLDGITQANLETAVAHLWEHGVDGPYDLLIADADKGSWSNTTNVTGWTKKADTLIQYGVQTDLAKVAGDYIGVIETSTYGVVRVRATGRVPTAYWSVYKSYGNDDQRNPLRVYPSPQYGMNAILLAGDHVREFPFENAILFVEFGVGVGDNRVSAVCVKNAASSVYSDPTIA